MFRVNYPTLDCRRCLQNKLTDGRLPICQSKGPSRCPISNGKAPELTSETQEVLGVYSLLSHEFVAKFPGLQTFILDNFVSAKTEEHLAVFIRLLCACYDSSVEISDMLRKSNQSGQPVGEDGIVLSKGAQHGR